MSALLRDRAGLLLAVFAASALGCLDVSPVTVDQPDATPLRDTSPPDVEPGDGEVSVDARTPCQDCLELTGCKDAVDACFAFKKCGDTYVCALANGCFASGDFETVVNCGIPCAKQAGMTDQTSPEASAIVAVVACATDACKSACAGK